MQNQVSYTESQQNAAYEQQDYITLKDLLAITITNESNANNNLMLFYQNYISQMTNYVNSIRGDADNLILQFMAQNAQRMVFTKGSTIVKSTNITLAGIDDLTIRKLTDANIRIADYTQAMYDVVQLYLLSKVNVKAKIVYTSGLNSILANVCKYCGPPALAPISIFLHYYNSSSEQMPLFLLLTLVDAVARSPKNPVIAYYHYAYMVAAGRDKINAANPRLLVNNTYLQVEEQFVSFMLSDLNKLQSKPYLQQLLLDPNFRNASGLSPFGQLLLVLLYNIDERNDRAFNILYHYLFNPFKLQNNFTIGDYSSNASSILVWSILTDYVPFFILSNLMKMYYNSTLQNKAYFLTYAMYLAVKRDYITYPLLHTMRFLEQDVTVQYNNLPYFLYGQYNIVRNVNLSPTYVSPMVDIPVDPAMVHIYQE